MRVIRSRPDANFTQIWNDVLGDIGLDPMTLGVLCRMLKNKDGWATTADAMWRQARKDRPGNGHGEGQRAYRAAFAKLEATGYLERRKLRTGTGQFETVLILHDRPVGSAPEEVTNVAETPPRFPPAETAHSPRSHQRCGYATLETATSITTREEQHYKNRGSINDLGSRANLVGPPTPGATASRRAGNGAVLASMRAAIVAVWGEQEWTESGSDESGLLALWDALAKDRRVGDRTAWLTRIFTLTKDAGHHLDSLMGRYVTPEAHRGRVHQHDPFCPETCTEGDCPRCLARGFHVEVNPALGICDFCAA